jgi:hypothetical protein
MHLQACASKLAPRSPSHDEHPTDAVRCGRGCIPTWSLGDILEHTNNVTTTLLMCAVLARCYLIHWVWVLGMCIYNCDINRQGNEVNFLFALTHVSRFLELIKHLLNGEDANRSKTRVDLHPAALRTRHAVFDESHAPVILVLMACMAYKIPSP